MRDVGVVLPAGGSGTRLGTRTPKQFLRLGGVPILALAARRFARRPDVAEIVVAAPPAMVRATERILRDHVRGARVIVVAGGPERQDSVWEGLQAVPTARPFVVVHDAVRPFVTSALIDAVLSAARDSGAAICALPITETVKRVREGVVESTVDRSVLWAVQTPQAFRGDLLREAHEKARRDGVLGTDESMLVERLGHPVRVMRGHPANVKITTPGDLRKARAAAR